MCIMVNRPDEPGRAESRLAAVPMVGGGWRLRDNAAGTTLTGIAMASSFIDDPEHWRRLAEEA